MEKIRNRILAGSAAVLLVGTLALGAFAVNKNSIISSEGCINNAFGQAYAGFKDNVFKACVPTGLLNFIP